MPKTKKAIIRLRTLDTLLSDPRHCYSLDELTEKVNDALCEIDPRSNGVTRRCIEKDLHFLEYELGLDADIDRFSVKYYNHKTGRNASKRCLRYSQQGFSIFNKEMSDEERELLSGAMSLLGNFDGLPELAQLENLRRSVSDIKHRNVISISKSPVSATNIFGTLFSAITHKQVIEVVYQRFKSPEPERHTVYPYLLKEYNRRWYLISKDMHDGNLTNMSLDRIKKVKTRPQEPFVEFDGDITKIFDEVIGVTFYKDSKNEHILFWVSDISNDYVATKPIHQSQHQFKDEEAAELRKQYPTLKGGTFFTIDCHTNYELFRELMSFGKDLLVLNPPKIQKEIFNTLNEMTSAYTSILPKP